MIDKNNVIKLSLTDEIVSQYPNIALTCSNATYNSIDFIEIVPK